MAAYVGSLYAAERTFAEDRRVVLADVISWCQEPPKGCSAVSARVVDNQTRYFSWKNLITHEVTFLKSSLLSMTKGEREATYEFMDFAVAFHSCNKHPQPVNKIIKAELVFKDKVFKLTRQTNPESAGNGSKGTQTDYQIDTWWLYPLPEEALVSGTSSSSEDFPKIVFYREKALTNTDTNPLPSALVMYDVVGCVSGPFCEKCSTKGTCDSKNTMTPWSTTYTHHDEGRAESDEIIVNPLDDNIIKAFGMALGLVVCSPKDLTDSEKVYPTTLEVEYDFGDIIGVNSTNQTSPPSKDPYLDTDLLPYTIGDALYDVVFKFYHIINTNDFSVTPRGRLKLIDASTRQLIKLGEQSHHEISTFPHYNSCGGDEGGKPPPPSPTGEPFVEIKTSYMCLDEPIMDGMIRHPYLDIDITIYNCEVGQTYYWRWEPGSIDPKSNKDLFSGKLSGSTVVSSVLTSTVPYWVEHIEYNAISIKRDGSKPEGYKDYWTIKVYKDPSYTILLPTNSFGTFYYDDWPIIYHQPPTEPMYIGTDITWQSDIPYVGYQFGQPVNRNPQTRHSWMFWVFNADHGKTLYWKVINGTTSPSMDSSDFLYVNGGRTQGEFFIDLTNTQTNINSPGGVSLPGSPLTIDFCDGVWGPCVKHLYVGCDTRDGLWTTMFYADWITIAEGTPSTPYKKYFRIGIYTDAAMTQLLYTSPEIEVINNGY